MIPTVILFGLIVGRWWAIPLAAAGWVLVVLDNADCAAGCHVGVAALAAANAAVGVGVHVAVRAVLRGRPADGRTSIT